MTEFELFKHGVGNSRADGSDEGNTYLLAESKAADEQPREIY